MLIRIDQWLITKFEKFAHWFQRMTGLDCFWLAKQCAIVRIFIAASAGIAFLVRGDHQLDAILAMCVLLPLHKLKVDLPDVVRTCWTALSHGCSNPRKLERGVRTLDAGIAVIITLFVLFCIVAAPTKSGPADYLIPLYWIVAAITEYLSACDPLPPCKSKVREWLRSIGRARIQKPVEV